jgi:hypothetical protein
VRRIYEAAKAIPPPTSASAVIVLCPATASADAEARTIAAIKAQCEASA